MMSCDCCGLGTVEVKCPYFVRDSHLRDLLKQNKPYVVYEDGDLILKEDHAYFYQVQGQMFACGVQHADFVIWKKNEISVERIYRNDIFLAKAMQQAGKFFRVALLPEIVARWFTRPKQSKVQAPVDSRASAAVDQLAALSPPSPQVADPGQAVQTLLLQSEPVHALPPVQTVQR